MKLPALGLDIFKILIFPTALQITNRLYIYNAIIISRDFDLGL